MILSLLTQGFINCSFQQKSKMKKSKAIAIGLLALSISACHKKEQRKDVDTWNQPATYVNDGNGYHNNGISPFWIFYAYHLGQNNHLSYQPSYGYRSRNGVYHTSSFGQTYSSRSGEGFGSHTTAGRATSRGGFGHSGSSHSVGA